MATQVKHRRGTQSEVDGFTPAIGEIVMNTSEEELVLGNGAKQGGIGIPKKSSTLLSFDTLSDALANQALKEGYSLIVSNRTSGGGGGVWDVVDSSTVSPNTFNIVQCTGVPSLALVLRLGETIDVKQFGAIGDGITDDTEALNTALSVSSGKVLKLPTGVYLINSQLVIKTKTKVVGDGRNRSTIKLSALFNSSEVAIRNETQTGLLNTYYDESIHIEGISFDGNNNPNRTVAFVSLSKILDVDIHHCGFVNHTYITVEIGANKDVLITHNYFQGNGRPKPSLVSAPCIWTDTVGGNIPFDVVIENNYFIDNNWSCAYFMPNRGSFSYNHCVGNGESGVFSNGNGFQLRYIGNHIESQGRSNISASGIETGAQHIVIADNIITGNDSDGVSLTDVQNAVVHDNVIFNNGQDSAYFTTAAGIAVITTASSPSQPDHINIHNNRIGDRQGTKTQVSGIVIGGTGSPVERVMITKNDMTEQKTNTIFIDPNKWGGNSFVSDNINKDGVMDKPFKVVRFQVAASTGVQQITGVGFRPRAIEIFAVLSSGSQAYTCVGVYDGLSSELNTSSSDGVGNSGSLTGSPNIINIRDSSATLLTDSDIVSLDVDGFTINNTVVSARPWCIAKCYM